MDRIEIRLFSEGCCSPHSNCSSAAQNSHETYEDKNSSFCSGSRLPDPLANFGDLVERGVGSEAEVGAGNVVADRGLGISDRS